MTVNKLNQRLEIPGVLLIRVGILDALRIFTRKASKYLGDILPQGWGKVDESTMRNSCRACKLRLCIS
jgi:hypothetical protein